MVVIPKRYIFKKLFDTVYPLQHIYPTKQKDVLKIINQLPETIQKVYVFGSSLTLHCGESSDIDILVVGDRSEEEYKAFSIILKQLDNEVDLIIKTPIEFEENLQIKNSICDVVVKEGLLIYERIIRTSTN